MSEKSLAELTNALTEAQKEASSKLASVKALQEVTRNMGPLRLKELRWLESIVKEYIRDEEISLNIPQVAE